MQLSWGSYARWVDRRRWHVLTLSALLSAGSLILALSLPLEADLAQLLPESERSVKDLKVLEGRTRVLGTMMAAVMSTDARLRQRAVASLDGRLRALGPGLVSRTVTDDGVARQFAWSQRYLYAPLDDLRDAHRGLVDRITRAKLEANPAY